MTFDEYQTAALRTCGNPDARILALGMTGEAGEVADLIKKIYGHGHPVDRDKIAKEIGDLLWYCATLSHFYGFTLSQVAAGNIAKLRARYPNGFSTEASQAKADEKPRVERTLIGYDANGSPTEGEP